MEKFYEFLQRDAQKNGIEKIVVGGVVQNKKCDILLLTQGRRFYAEHRRVAKR